MIERRTDVLTPLLPASAGADLAIGTLAGSWRIVSRIASGGCGVVYAARHPVLDRVAALKVLRPELISSGDIVSRFVHEARAVNQIRHPNIVDIFDFGVLGDGRPFFVMELLAPGDLEDRIASQGRFRLDEMMSIVEPIGHALDAAHRAGYIHRDLKARNIGFAGTPDAPVPKLLDFGISKLLETGRDGATCTIRVGTPQCMAPEQIRGARIDARTDIYAFGVLLHQMLTGRCPYEADTAAEIERMHLEAPPPPPSRLVPVSPAIDAIVLRALAKRPADRPSSVRELLALLAAAVGTGGNLTRRDAIAIHVAVEVPDPFDDLDLDDAARATTQAVELLSAAGFIPVMRTATSLVAARAVDSDPSAGTGAVHVASELERTLMTRPGTRPGVTTRVAIRAGAAQFAGDTCVGGELLDVHMWSA